MESQKSNGSTAVDVSFNGTPSPMTDDDNLSKSYERTSPETSGRLKNVKKCLGENALTLATLLGVLLGIVIGVGLRYSNRKWTKREIMYINFPGELFLSMLKCLILPLIVSSLISAVGNLDTKLTGKIGFRAVSFYMTTTLLAIILGIILVVSIKPGVGSSDDQAHDESEEDENEMKYTLTEDTLMDLLRNLFPPNIMEATILQHNLALIKPKNWTKLKNETTEEDLKKWDFETTTVEQTNILGCVVFSIVFGITLSNMKRRGRPLLKAFMCLSDAMMQITKMVIFLSPVGIMFLVASKILEINDLGTIFGQIGMYFATVLCGILLHGFLVIPVIYLVLVRKNPVRFIINMAQALATAFGTSSSSATMPVTIDCLEEKNLLDRRVTRFCVPIGATINMDGTALYEAVAAIFIAQLRQVELSVGKIIAISITATAASIGAAGIPQAGLVTMVMVLNVIGLPAKDVSLILVVDWLLDRFRTLINVLGDSFGCGIVAHFSKDDLAEIADDDAASASLEQTTTL